MVTRSVYDKTMYNISFHYFSNLKFSSRCVDARTFQFLAVASFSSYSTSGFTIHLREL